MLQKQAAFAVLVLSLLGAEAKSETATHSADAQFRWIAKDMFESLEEPSCTVEGLQSPPGFRRAELLKSEGASVEAFEKAIRNTPAQFHFDVAKADAAFAVAKRAGCWAEYNDLQVAQRHLKMTQEDVRVGLARMEELAPSTTEPVQTHVSAAEGVEFRALVRDLVRTSMPRCRQTVKADNQTILAPARAAVAQFRSRLANSDYAAHFDIARGDVEYSDSVTSVECDDPGRQSPGKVSGDFLDSVRRQIAALQRKFVLSPS